MCALLSGVSASHFRFGHISWKVLNPATPLNVTFYVNLAFRWDFNWQASGGYTGTAPAVGNVINVGQLTWGYNTTATNVLLLINSIDSSANDWLTGTFSTWHDYTQKAPVNNALPANYTVAFAAAARINTLINNHGASWNVTTVVNVNTFVTNAAGTVVLNSSPVSNLLPIVPVIWNATNVFNVTAVDNEGQALTYSLASGIDMGGASETLPVGFTISKTGTVTWPTQGLAVGLYCAQVKIWDGLCYSVVDWILDLQPNTICNPSCSNPAGTRCTSASSCTGCPSSLTASQTCAVAFTPQFQSPTPSNGAGYTASIGNSMSWTWNVSTLNPTSKYINLTTGTLPSGGVLSPQVGLNPTTQKFTWTPTTSQAGSWVISLGCHDDLNLQCTTQSFSINVATPFCGNGGTVVPSGCVPGGSTTCTCSCPTGFSASSRCFDCNQGYYGSSCTPCSSCVNGICSSGVSGTGVCTCTTGWMGSDCNTTVSVPCSIRGPSSVISYTSTGALMNPNAEVTYIQLNPVAAPLRLNFVNQIPAAPAKLDVLFLVELTSNITNTMLSNLQTSASNYITNVRGSTADSYFGLASFSDLPSATGCSASNYAFRLHLALSGTSSDFTSALSTYMVQTTNGCQNQNAQLNALVQASNISSGWRSGSYKMIIVVTNSGYNSGGNYNTPQQVLTALAYANIVPIFIATSSVKTSYATLATQLGFGLAAQTSSTYSDTYSVAWANQQTAYRNVWTAIGQDQYGFVSATSPITVTTGAQNVSTFVNITYNQKYLNQIVQPPTVIVSTLGYAQASVVTQVNRMPVAGVCAIVTREDISAAVTVLATDLDNNAMTIVLSSLPQNGKLYVNATASVGVSTLTSYGLPNNNPVLPFYYTPNLHWSGVDSFMYNITDGCSTTAVFTCTITVNYYNYPPVANNIDLQAYENTNLTVQLSGSDVEDASGSLLATITSLPQATMGVLYHMDGVRAITQNEQLTASDAQQILFVPTQWFSGDTAVFNYQFTDSGGAPSNSAQGSIFINWVNQIPSGSAPSPVAVERTVPTTFTLNVVDHDIGQAEYFNCTAYTSGAGGSFQMANGVAFPASSPFVIGSVSMDASYSKSISVTYTAPATATGTGYASLTFLITDAAGATSGSTTISMNINPDHNPTANSVSPVSVNQGQNATITMSGNDVDPADANNLQVVISALPLKGTLYQNGVAITTTGVIASANSAASIVFQGSPTIGVYGNDSFSFRLQDNLGALSAPQVVSVTVKAVNHPPSGSFAPGQATEDQMYLGTIVASDPDGNPCTVYITSLPAVGTLYQADGVTVINTVGTALTDTTNFQFQFLGALHAYGTPYTTFQFQVNDNQGQSNSLSPVVTATMNVKFVNYPPTAYTMTITVQENSPVTFTLNATDIETPSTVQGSITSSPSFGTITDSNGNAIPAKQLIPAPRTITYTPPAYTYGTTSFSFSAYDGTQYSAQTATVTLNIVHVNTAPTISGPSSVTVTRGVPATITVTVTDPDTSDVETFTVTSYSAGTGGAFTDSNGQAFSGSTYQLPEQPTMTASSHSGTASFSYLAPANAKTNPFASLTVGVADQTGAPANPPVSININIAPNNLPVATANSIGATQDVMSSAITLTGTDADVIDQNSLTVIINSLPQIGTLYNNGVALSGSTPITLPAGNSITYQTFTRGSDQFAFSVVDSVGGVSGQVIVPISIAITNHKPTASWIGAPSVNENGVVTISQMSGSDQDGNPIQFSIASTPSNGVLTQYPSGSACTTAPCTVTDSSARMVYTPNPNFYGTDSFTFYVTDTVSNLQSTAATGTITINHVNQAPVAVDGSATGNEDAGPITISPSVTDVDNPAQGQTLYYIIQSLPSPSIGTLYIGATAVTVNQKIVSTTSMSFQLVQYANGAPTFTFNGFDGSLASKNTATFTINVQAVENPPTSSMVPASPDVVPLPASGTGLNAINLIVNDPDKIDTFTFYLLSVHINRANTHATPHLYLAGSSTELTPGILGKIAANGQTSRSIQLSVVVASNDVGNGADGTPISVSFTWCVDDGHTNASVVSMQVTTSNDQAPTAMNPSGLTAQEGATTPTTVTLEGDAGTSGDSVTIIILSTPKGGNLYNSSSATSASQITSASTPNQLGAYTVNQLITNVYYLPTGYFNGPDSFTWYVLNNHGISSPQQTTTITVNHVDHAPVAYGSPASTQENQAVVISSIATSDVDQNDVVYVVVNTLPLYGTLKDAQNSNAAITTSTQIASPYDVIYTPNTNFNGTDSFTYKAYDGTLYSSPYTLAVTIQHVDQPPVATAGTLTVYEGTGGAYTMGATDIDNFDNEISAYVTSLPDSSTGVLYHSDQITAVKTSDQINPRSVWFVPAGLYSGSSSFSFIAFDGSLYSSSAQVTITVQHVNHAPVAIASDVTIARGAITAIPVAGSDVDVGDTLHFVLLTASDSHFQNSVGGSLAAGNAIGASSYPRNSVGVASTSNSLYYNMPSNAIPTSASAPFATGSFNVIDSSSNATTDIATPPGSFNIYVVPNTNPVATAMSVNVTEDVTSPNIVMTGTDADPADSGHLVTIITSIPTGNLNVNGVPLVIANVPYTVQPTDQITYATNAYQRGTDSWNFYVQDLVGGKSQPAKVSITITPVNHPPTAGFAGLVSTPENVNVTIQGITASDPDGEAVAVYIVAPPASGQLFQFNGAPITAANTAITDSSFRVVFVPTYQTWGTPYTSFQFYAQDAAGQNSSQITVPINVTFVDVAPNAYGSTLSILEGSAPTTFLLNTTDIQPQTAVYVFFLSLPSAAIGVISANGVPVEIFNGTSPVYLANTSFVLTVPTIGFGNTSFTYQATDGTLQSAAAPTVSIVVTAVNHPPTATVITPISVQRDVPQTFQLNAIDIDTPENFVFVITATVPSGANLTDPSGQTIVSGVQHNVSVSKSAASTPISLSFTAPSIASGSSYATLSFYVVDGSNAASPSLSLTIGIQPDTPPSANPAGPVTLLEEQTSGSFVLNGTDADPADADNLKIQITSLPTKGVLYVNGVLATVGMNVSAPAEVSVAGNTLTYGNDQFTYQIFDLMGESTGITACPIVITHVNHAPSGFFSAPPVPENTNMIITLFATDPDNDQRLTPLITRSPSTGLLTQADGTPIKGASVANPVAVTSLYGTVYYTAPTGAYGSPVDSFDFRVTDNYPGGYNALSPVVTALLNFTQVDQPPVAYPSNITAPQNTPIYIPLNAVDPQGFALTYTVTLFPGNGQLFRADGVTPITPSNPTTGANNTIVYVGPSSGYSTNPAVPYAFFTFTATSNVSLTSNAVTINMFITQAFPAPSYQGPTVFTIPENAVANMLLIGYSQTGSYTIQVVNTVTNGSLYQQTCFEMCVNTYITGPTLLSDANEENRLYFSPPANTSGNPFTSYQIQVIDAYGASAVVTITIIVYHVDVPPTVLPISYTNVNATMPWATIVTLDQDTDIFLTWNVTDPDTPLVNLTTYVAALPYEGSLFYVQDTANGMVIGDEINITNTQLHHMSDNLWHMIYRPAPGKAGVNYATFTLIAYDAVFEGPRLTTRLSVVHLNEAPYVNITTHLWNATSNGTVVITGVTVTDPDAGFLPIMFNLSTTLVSGNKTIPQSANSSISLLKYDPSYCVASNSGVVCTAAQEKLNQILTQISFRAPILADGEQFYLTVFVNDLGSGAEASMRSTSAKNASDFCTINVSVEPPVPTTQAGSNSALTAAVAVSGAAGAAGALGLWRYLKKRNPPTADFFGMEGFNDMPIGDNPLYEGSGPSHFSNPLYKEDSGLSPR